MDTIKTQTTHTHSHTKWETRTKEKAESHIWTKRTNETSEEKQPL